MKWSTIFTFDYKKYEWIEEHTTKGLTIELKKMRNKFLNENESCLYQIEYYGRYYLAVQNIDFSEKRAHSEEGYNTFVTDDLDRAMEIILIMKEEVEKRKEEEDDYGF